MRTTMKLLIVFISVGLCLQSCSKDNFEEVVLSRNEIEEPVAKNVASGILTLDAIIKDAITITTARALTLEEALDVMQVEITSTNGLTTYISENYRDLPATIELPAGNYDMLISNYPLTDARFDEAVYGDYIENFEITTGNNTVLNPVLELLDVATTVNFSSEILAAYPDISVYVARSGVNASIFGEFPLELRYGPLEDGRRGYHNLFSGSHASGFTKHSGELYIAISATGVGGEAILVTRFIEGVTGNQHYNINIEMTAPSSTSLDVTLEPEDENTEIITFPN